MVNPAKFVREVRSEASKVTWPTRKEVMVSSGLVVVMTIIAAIFFILVDNISQWLVQLILGLGG